MAEIWSLGKVNITMAGSFQERLDIFCSDFAVIGHAVRKAEVPSLELVREQLPRALSEDQDDFSFRCDAIIHAFSYVSEHLTAFHNIGYIRDTEDGAWTIEGPLLYALCLYLGGENSQFESPPELEVVIDAALHGPRMNPRRNSERSASQQPTLVEQARG